ncbi:putative LRR receptor-like serine/threonine-protein kinase At5g59680 [Carex rostrata]
MDEQDLNLALTANVDEGPSAIDVDSIIASKNITDETTIEFLIDLVKSRNIKKGDDGIEASTSSANEVHLNWGLDGIESEDELTDEEEGGEEYNGTIDETENNLYTNRLEINESSIFKNESFINIDCGIASNTSYDDSFTGLRYISDDQYIDTGLNGKISSQHPVNKNKYTNLETLRSFPNSTKNCYTLTPATKGSKYLLRATFYYGNYDGLENSPSFDLYFGVNFWSSITISEPDYWYAFEIIAIAPANYIEVCLLNTGLGTPFISVLELRPLTSTLYELANATKSLNLIYRGDVGSNNSVVRYPDDNHDRLWFNYTESSWAKISTGSSIDGFLFEVPSLVLQTAAVTSTASNPLDITWSTSNKSDIFFVVLHFAEIQIMQNTSLREFYVYANGEQKFKDPVPIKKYLNPVYSWYLDTGRTNYNMSLKSSPRATLPPLLNAFESMPLNQSRRVIVLGKIGMVILAFLQVTVGVGYARKQLSSIFCRNLSSSGLTGAMVSAFGYLTELEKLDLSHNNLSGNIPNSLDELTSLTFLDLSENSGLSRTLPPGLQKRQKDGHLTVLFNSTDAGSGHKKSSKAVIFIIVAVVIVLLIIGVVTLFFLCQKKSKKDKRINPPTTHEDPTSIGTGNSSHVIDDPNNPSKSGAGGKASNFDKKQFSFSELKLITNDFREKIGIGGFGEVFKGRLGNGNEVAVKVRSESSSQGAQQFLNEVTGLSRVHHKNLVSLVGYCMDGNYIALIYDYMQQGNLQNWLRGCNTQPLSWKQRLRIAYESAQGLEYLHKMCNPPLIHRDVKTSNILLTRNLEAKVSDFGLVRAFTGTHVSTKVVGTPGYLDPHYASTSHLIEKSDVYSFGVVLLEIITGKTPIHQGLQRSQHLTQFVQQRLSKGNIESILDPYLGGQYNLNSIWKVAELALRCTDLPAKRPDMTAVVTELKESMDLEMSSFETGSVASGSIREYSGNFEMAQIGGSGLPDHGPLAR